MGVIKKFNPETKKWEIYGSTDAKDINLIDVNGNFETKNVESALRELSEKLSESVAYLDAHNQTLTEHTESIEWLKINGGGGGSGGGGGGGGSIIPTITSKFEDNTTVQKGEEVKIPFFFSSPSLGNGTVYVMINGIEVMSFSDIKQGNNTINIGTLTELKSEVSIYVKDRAGLLSNQLEWTIICGGLELFLNFDYEADYSITDIITMQYEIVSVSEEPIILHLSIDYDEYEISCSNGINTYTFSELGVGIHEVKMYATSGTYKTPVINFNMIIVNANSLYVSSTFVDGTEATYGTPVAIQYRISKATQETFTIKLFLNDVLDKTMEAKAGTYYWTINNMPIGAYTARIEVTSAFDEFVSITKTFQIVKGEYTPLQITKNGLIYRLDASSRTNQDSDKANPIDDSGNGTVTTLHNFNYFTNGWIDGELVCNGEAYVEIDLYPWLSNAIYGSTIEIHYTALDIGIQNARIFDYTDINAPYKGVYVDLEETSMKSLANTGTLSVDKDADTTLTFVIDRSEKFGKIFINGICSRAFSLSDSGSGVNATREDFTHSQKIYLNSKKGLESYGACNIKDVRIYDRTLSDDEIVNNYIAQITDLEEQEKVYNFNYNNTTLPRIDMYGDTKNMTLETPVTMRIKYTSPNEDKYGQSFDLPYCQVNWQGTSSLQYVLKNFTARLKDENMAEYLYTPYPNGVKESVYCFKADYMESSHSRNVGIAKFVNECLYDTKTPVQMKNSNIRNTVNGFPCLMYINNELQGVYNFNLDRYSTLSYGYTDPTSCLVYEVSANSDTTAGAFYKWTEASGKNQLDYYKSDYECLYPPTRAGGNDNMAELIRLIEWVDDSSDEVFRDNIRNYFDLEYLLRYYLFVLIFGAVDSLGKNMKLATWDGRIWYPQVYDADTTIGLDNTGFLKFDMDIEMGDEGVFNTTGSNLWKKVVLLFQEQLKTEYALMRQDRFTVDNIMKYLYEEQIAKIPATFYNKDMRTKYLNFGSSYLYALHGSSEQHIKKWIRERIMYVDTLLGYTPSSADYITLRSSKLGYVYLDIQAYIPMYVSVKWRDEANNTGLQTKRVGRGETVRFEYNMPTATDQEIIVYAGYYLKSLGDVSNLQPTSMLIANASRLTEITCHSPNLINTDLSECKLLQRIDLSDSTALGTGLGGQPILNIQNCKYLKYCNCHNTKLTAIYTMQQGGNLEEIYYPASTQVIQLQNQEYLHTVGIPYDESKDIACKNLQQVTIENCKNVKYIQYPFEVGEPLNFKAFKYVQNLNLENSLDGLTAMKFTGFNELRTVRLSSLGNLSSLNFDDMLQIFEESKLTSIEVSDCPLITTVTFNVSNADRYKVEFAQGCNINLGGVRTIKTIECNTNIIGLDTLIIPTSTKELKFIRTASGEVNDIKSIFSATANHAFDGFVGLDLKDIELTYLDMSSLGITNALNFYIAPTTQHPNLNTYRDGVNQPYFCPEGELDLTNYEGNMRAMFKGLDFNKLKIKMPTKEFSDLDISSLFEGATLTNDINVGFVLSKFPYANNFDYIFKNSNASDITSILFPSHRFSLREGFMNTLITRDISLPLQVTDVTRCFKDCIHITKVTSNWTKSFSFNPLHEECYAGCVNIEYIDGKEGAIHNIPVDWGGFGFIKGLMGKYTVEILSDNYFLRLGDLVDEGTVEWGDGSYTIGENSHLFTYSGIYTIYGKIYPNIEREEPHVSLSSVLINVSEIPYAYATTYSNMFSNCSLLRYIDLSTTDTSNIEDMSGMFRNCVSMFTPPILDYSNVSNVDEMFMGCREIYEIIFENLTNKNMTIENFIDGCMGLTTIEFRGRVDKVIGRKVIEEFNTFILENFANEINYANEISMLSLRTTEIEDEQDTQGEQIEVLEMSQTVQEEQLMETMMAMTSMYEAIGVMMSSFANEENALNDFDKQMVKIYTTLVIKGYKKIEDIPILLREIVKKNIEK